MTRNLICTQVRRWLVLVCVLSLACRSNVTHEALTFGRFGSVVVYRPASAASSVVLFVSGDEGWNQEAVALAQALADLGAVVVGIDLRQYRKALAESDESCSYPGGDFEGLSKFIQKKFAFPAYLLPVLAGYGAGATFAYAALAQAPPEMFQGVLSLSFCPHLLLGKPFCQWNALAWPDNAQGREYRFLPAAHLHAPWIVLQGTKDEVCEATAVATYVKQVGRGQVVMVPEEGHRFSAPERWRPPLQQAFTRIVEKTPAGATRQPKALSDLPLVEVPAVGPGGETLAVILSGDGGWASIDRELGNTLAGQGVAVVGLNSLKYFWTRRTPDSAAQDLERLLRYYLEAWHKEKVLLIGYSRGADVLPFLANRLRPDLLAKIGLVALLGPAQSVDFEFHLTDWLGDVASATARPVLPEVEKLRGTKVLCVYGEEEPESLCKKVDAHAATVVRLAGGHHFDANYSTLAQTILQAAR